MRFSGSIASIYKELVVTGSRVQVADTIDQIAADCCIAAKLAQAATQLSGTQTFSGAKFTATAAELAKIDPKIADRLNRAMRPRAQADLQAAIAGNDVVERGLALCNVLVNDFQCSVKGGIVRDVIIRGLAQFKDIDIDMPSGIQAATWRNTLDQQWLAKLRQDYGMAATASGLQPRTITDPQSGTKYVDGIIAVNFAQPAVEFEFVAPWCACYLPARNVDFTVNNLRLDPGPPAISQTCGIGLTVQYIVAQLRQAKPQASPLYNIDWSPTVPTGENGEGYSQNKFVVTKAGLTPQQAQVMNLRLKWARKKGFWLVESSSIVSPGGVVHLYHGTSQAAAKSIIAGGFNASAVGNLGAGVYMSRDLKICLMFVKSTPGAKGTILEADVDPGKLYFATGFGSTGRSWTTYDSVFLDASYSPRQLEEWAIRDPKRITKVKIYI